MNVEGFRKALGETSSQPVSLSSLALGKCPRCQGRLVEVNEVVSDPQVHEWHPWRCLCCGFYTDELMELNRQRSLSGKKKMEVPNRRWTLNPADVWWLRTFENLTFEAIGERLGVTAFQAANSYHHWMVTIGKR